ncbi:MAG: L-2-hydroxyglutarate oxidase [Candidatus Limnocylindrales bacterium]
MTERFDIAVIGGGIVGLATALRLLQRAPHLRLAVLEKEPELATHQTGHNSGVLHSGLYYQPGSLKARLCRAGKSEIERFADAHEVPWKRTGKLVVALDRSELPRLAALRERGDANGLQGLEEIGPERIREIEPHVTGIRALWVPETGIVDFRRLALALADDLERADVRILTNRQVTGLTRLPSGEDGATAWLISTPHDTYLAGGVIACAGLQSDRVARFTGHEGRERIVPFRGDYYHLRPAARHLVHGLVYPVPDPAFPFLGIHFTRRVDGEVWAGPNAVPALARQGYARRDLSARDLASSVTWPGLWRLALPYVRTGLQEAWRDVSKAAFLRGLQRYVPELRMQDIEFGPSGIRAQSLGADGRLVDDFSLGEGAGIIHVRNAPSPAATASLAIGNMLAERAVERFDLKATRS